MLRSIRNVAMSRFFAVLLGCVTTSLAWGQPRAVPPAEAPVASKELLRGRAELSTALSLRSGGLETNDVDVVYGGFPSPPSPTYFNFAGVYFPEKWPAGVAINATFDTFRLEGRALEDEVDARLNSAVLGVAAVWGFELPLRSYGELQAGLEGGGFALAAVEGLGVRVRRVGYLGLQLSALLQVPITDPWSVILRIGALPSSAGGVEGLPSSVRRFDAAVQVAWGKYRLGGFDGALYGEYAFSRQIASGGDDKLGYFAHRNSHRFGVGLRFLLPEVIGPPPPPTGPGRLRGRLLFAENQEPANGVEILVNGEQVTRTTSDGRFIASAVGPGKVTFTARATGYAPLNREVEIAPETEVTLEPMTLERPSGPGTLTGTARLRLGPERVEAAPGVTVTVDGQPVKMAPDGSFEVEKVGPGPVTVVARAKGYKTVEEVAAVPPNGAASVELILERTGVGELAAFRGQVRSTAGAAIQATLRIPEARIRTRTKTDGTFQVRLPAGRYTVVFEAEGFVSQSKAVEVAGGDQTLFYIDLTPSDR